MHIFTRTAIVELIWVSAYHDIKRNRKFEECAQHIIRRNLVVLSWPTELMTVDLGMLQLVGLQPTPIEYQCRFCLLGRKKNLILVVF